MKGTFKLISRKINPQWQPYRNKNTKSQITVYKTLQRKINYTKSIGSWMYTIYILVLDAAFF